MSTNPKQEYNDTIRANLPGYIQYDSVRNQYVTANGKRFVTYLEAKWYCDYLIKFGSNIEYAANNIVPDLYLDFTKEVYEK